MSLYHQPKISTDGLIYTFDPTNLRCVPISQFGFRDQGILNGFASSGSDYNRFMDSDEIEYETITFTRESGNPGGNFTVSFRDTVPNLQYLIVAGGGGGGGSLGGGAAGGGGGAGGLIEGTFSTLSAGTYNVVVGAGGAGGPTGDNTGSNGGNSSIFGLTAIGGGGGGPRDGAGPGQNGGSGGGANSSVAGTGVAGQGFGGGTSSNSVSPSAGGGGGGAGGAGANASADFFKAGAGGVGKSSSISGTATFYAGGGGGGNGSLPNTGFGGNGGGGDGGNGVDVNITNSHSDPGFDGVNGTGGGGGGAGGASSGGDGGTGIIIIRYPVVSRQYKNLYVDYRGGNYSSLTGRYAGTTFSGDRYVHSVPANSAVRNSLVLDSNVGFNDNEEFTLNFWVKLDNAALENVYSLVGRFTTTGHIYVDQETALLDGSEWILRWRTQGNTTFNLTDIITDTNIKQQYVNITISCDSSRSVKTYLNGILRKTTTAPDTSAMTVSTLFGGYRNSTTHLSWHGFVGPAHIYGRQLSDREVRDNYLAYAPRYA